VKVDVRIISATNRNLMTDVNSGRFREDLFYRLHVFPITVPPLRERIEDIPELTRHFLVRFAAEEGKHIRSMSAETLHMLTAYRWPGNVRQLENAIFRAVVLADGEEVTCGEFPQMAAQIGDADAVNRNFPALMSAQVRPNNMTPTDDANADQLCGTFMGQAASEAPLFIDDGAGREHPLIPESATGGGTTLNLLNGGGDVRSLEDIEADVIRFALAHYRGRMSEVARRLRIGRSTLYRKLDNLGLANLGATMANDANA